MRRIGLGAFLVLGIFTAGCGGPPPAETDAGGSDGGGTDTGRPPVDGGPVDAGDVDAFVPSSVLVHAAEGGLVRSADGVLEIAILPNALASDTTISITRLDTVPTDIAAELPLGAVYDVQPDGLTFAARGAWGHYHFATPPADLVTGTPPDHGTADARMRPAAGGAIESSLETYVIHEPDGSVDVLAMLPHLSYHFVTGHGTLGRCQARLDMNDGMHAERSSWSAAGMVRCDVAPSSVSVTTYADPSGVVEVVPSPGGAARSYFQGDPLLRELLPFLGPEYVGSAVALGGGPFVASQLYPLVPAPSWRCARTGRSTVRLDVSFSTGMRRTSVVEYGDVDCIAAPATETRCGDGLDDDADGTIDCADSDCPCDAAAEQHALVGDVTPCAQVGGNITCSGAVSAAIDVIHATTATAAGLTPVDLHSVVFDGLAFESRPGAATVDVDTGAATGHASYDATEHRYVATVDLSSGSVYDATRSASWTSSNGGAPLVVAAPAAGTITFGTPAGDDTEVHVDDGACDALEIILTATGCADTTPGHACGARTLVDLADLPLVGADRVTPLAAPGIQTEFASLGLVTQSALVGCVNWTTDGSIFPAETPLQVGAARFVRATAAALTPPLTTGPDAQACPPPAHVFAQPGPFDTAQVVMCVNGSSCRITNDLMRASPLLPTQCALADWAVRISGGSSPSVLPQSGWTLDWASTGVTRSATTPVLDQPGSIWITRSSDHVRYEVDYTASADRIAVTSARPFTGTLPPWGAAYHCDALPQTFSDPVDLFGTSIDARICYTPPGLFGQCDVQGDTTSTPQNEGCTRDYAIGLGFDDTNVPFAWASPPGLSDWTLESASAGTVAGDMVTGIPVGVDVTFVTVIGTVRLQTVARWSASAVTVQSVTPL